MTRIPPGRALVALAVALLLSFPTQGAQTVLPAGVLGRWAGSAKLTNEWGASPCSYAGSESPPAVTLEIESLDAEYTRTAVLKGLPRRTVIRRHVLRNSLLPTIAVIATQTGYLIGGLVVIETLFNYPGMGRLIFTAAQKKDFPLLETGVLIVGIVFLVATLPSLVALPYYKVFFLFPIQLLATLSFARPARRRNLASRAAGSQTTVTPS